MSNPVEAVRRRHKNDMSRFPWLKIYIFTTYAIVLWHGCLEGFDLLYWLLRAMIKEL